MPGPIQSNRAQYTLPAHERISVQPTALARASAQNAVRRRAAGAGCDAAQAQRATPSGAASPSPSRTRIPGLAR